LGIFEKNLVLFCPNKPVTLLFIHTPIE